MRYLAVWLIGLASLAGFIGFAATILYWITDGYTWNGDD